jgi:hypothetical protein
MAFLGLAVLVSGTLMAGIEYTGDSEGILVLQAAAADTTLGTLVAEVAPPPGGAGLLIHLFFEEKEGGFLRVFWKSGDSTVTLSDNLYEGISMPNQRSLLIPAETLGAGGELTFQASQSDLHVRRIRWEWLKPLSLLSAPDPKIRVLDALGTPMKADEVNGELSLIPDDLWKGPVVTAQITEKAERIEDGVEFPVELDKAPVLARLECRINGLGLADSLLLWINGNKVGTLLPEVPDLNDPGYVKQSNGTVVYQGWRKATAWVPATFLQKGTNRLQFSQASETEALPGPLALKEMKLQLSYAESGKDLPIKDSPSQEELVPAP